jgi:hypothetical protein
LDVLGETHLIDPTVEPGATVGSVQGEWSKGHLKLRVILSKEHVLAGIIEACNARHKRVLGPLLELLIVFFIVVLAGIFPCITELDPFMYLIK